MRIDVVIPTWNRAELLTSCLEHLARQTIEHGVVVVDNASTDGSREMVRQQFPSARLIALPANEGFARAVNRGAAASDAEVVIVINNDVYAEPGMVAELAAPLARDPRLGMVSGVLVDPRSGRVDAAGVQIDGGLGGYPFCGGALLSELAPSRDSLLGPSGGSAAFRRTALASVGGYDEAIFAYSEDVDLALRLRVAGWACALAPAARGVHVGSASFGLRSPGQLAVAAEGRGYVLGRYRVGPQWLALEAVAAAANGLLSGSLAPVTALARGWRRGRRMSARPLPAEAEPLRIGLREALKRRLAAIAPSEAPMRANNAGTDECAVCGAPPAPPSICGPDRLHATPGRFSIAICPECGAGNTLPPVSDSDLGALYPGEYSPHGSPPGSILRGVSFAIRAAQGWMALRTFPLAALSDHPAGRAVDIGCGRGDLAATLAGRGWRMTGVEPSTAACAIAAERSIDARAGDLSSVTLERQSYDAAIFVHSLEHLSDPVRDLGRAHSALRDGGLVLVTLPNFDSWQRRWLGGRWFHLDLPRHRVHYGAPALRCALERAGFEPLQMTTSTSVVGLPATLQYALAGRCLFPSGMALRIATGLCLASWPLARLLDRVAGQGDLLHVVARSRAGRSACGSHDGVGR